MLYHIFFSPTGGTKKVGEILCRALGGAEKEMDLCHEIPETRLSNDDVCVISVPSFGGRVPDINVKRLKQISGSGAKAILNCVYGNRHWDDTLTELQDVLEEQGFVCAAAIAAVAEHSVFRQFAAGRPDAKDAEQLCAFAGEISKKLAGGVFEKLELAGQHGNYKVYNGAPFKPEANDNCTLCGLCARECPAGAIDKAYPKETDPQVCISCMRCIAICPRGARGLDEAFMAQRAEKMAAVLGGHKENYLFL